MNKLFFAIIVLLLSAGHGFAGSSIPNVFENGTVADADKINENFTALGTAIDNIAMSTTIRTVFSDKNTENSGGSEILNIACNAGEILIGGGCACSSNNHDYSTTNWGNLIYCYPYATSYIGGCFTSFSDWDNSKYGPAITVYAICAKITSNKNIKAVKEEKNNEKLNNLIEKLESARDKHEQYMINKMNGLE